MLCNLLYFTCKSNFEFVLQARTLARIGTKYINAFDKRATDYLRLSNHFVEVTNETTQNIKEHEWNYVRQIK